MASQTSGASARAKEYHILLVGMTGQGKSATGNTILGSEKFVSMGGPESCTRAHHVGTAENEGYVFKVVDIPGYADTGRTDAAGRQLVVDALSDVLIKFPNGFDVVLLVFAYGTRLTEAERKGIQELQNLCDTDAFKSHGIVVMSYGDGFTRDQKKKNGPSFDNWRKQQPMEFQWIFQTCNNRCVLFDNVTEDQEIKKCQLMDLVSQMHAIKIETGGRRYIPEICKMHTGDVPQFSKDRLTVVALELVCSYLSLAEAKIDEFVKTPFTDNGTLCLLKENVDTVMNSAMAEKEASFLNDNYILFFKLLNAMNLDNIRVKGVELKSHLVEMQNEVDSKIKSTLFWRKVTQRIRRFIDNLQCCIL